MRNEHSSSDEEVVEITPQKDVLVTNDGSEDETTPLGGGVQMPETSMKHVILHRALPLMLVDVCFSVNIIFRNYLLTRTDDTTVTNSITLILDTLNFVEAIGTSFLDPFGVMLKRLYSQNKYNETGTLLQQGIIFSQIIAAFVVIILLFITKPLMLLFNEPEELIPIVDRFAAFYAIAIPFRMLAKINLANFVVLEKEWWFLVYAMLDLGVGTLGNWLLIPIMREAGVGVSTAMTNGCGAIFMLVLYLKHPTFQKLQVFGSFRAKERLGKLYKTLKLSFPLLVYSLILKPIRFLRASFIGDLEEDDRFAIDQAASQYIQYITPFIFACAVLTSMFVSDYEGKKKYVHARRAGNLFIAIAAGVSVVLLLAYILLPIPMAKFYMPDQYTPELDGVIRLSFLLVGIGVLLNNVITITGQGLQGEKKTLIPSLVNLFSNALLLSVFTYVAVKKLDLGIVGVMAGTTFSALVGCLLIVSYWIYQSMPSRRRASENQTNQGFFDELIFWKTDSNAGDDLSAKETVADCLSTLAFWKKRDSTKYQRFSDEEGVDPSVTAAI